MKNLLAIAHYVLITNRYRTCRPTPVPTGRSASTPVSRLACGLIASCFACALPAVGQAEPRIAPLAQDAWSEEQHRLAESLPEPPTNAFATFLHNPLLTRHIMPFERFITADSTLTARDRQLLILRTAWLTRSEYLWAHHADPAARGTLNTQELTDIARGPDVARWSSFDAALLSAADELHVDSFITDTTWASLAARLTTKELLDLLFTVGEFTMLAGAVNSLQLEIEPGHQERLPSGVPYVTHARRTNERLIGRQPRILPIERTEWTDDIQALLDPRNTGRRIANVYRTYVHHLPMDLLRRGVSEHIRDATTLSDWQREVLIIRIGVLCRSEYEWAAHSRIGRSIGMREADIERIVAGPTASGREPMDRALLQATDELYRDDYISDRTWRELSESLDTPQLLDLLITVGGYRMFSMAMNSIGVQLDSDENRFPVELR